MQFKLDANRRNVPSKVYLDDLRSVSERVKKSTVTVQEYSDLGIYSPSSLMRRFGSWPDALQAAGLSIEHHNGGVSREAALADLIEVAKRLNKTSLTRAEYSRNGRYSSKPLLNHFGSWQKALEAGGLQPSRNYAVPDERLFANLEQIWRSLGHQPKYGEIAKPLSEYSAGTYEQRFGSWRKALEAFVQFVDSAPEQEVKSDEPPTPMIQSEAPTRRKTPRSVNWRLRFLVMQRDGFRCKLCGASPATEVKTRLHVDHIVAWSNGGDTMIENLQTCCETCNIGKSNLPISEERS